MHQQGKSRARPRRPGAGCALTAVLAANWPTLVAGAALGWVAGLASSRLVAIVVHGQVASARGALQRWVVGDVLVQATLAVVGVLIPLTVLGPAWRWLLALLLAVPVVQVAVTDLRERYVYTAVALVGIVLGVFGSPIVHQAPWWSGGAGALVGWLAFGALYVLGRWLYHGREPLALGDVTIAAMVGAVAGPSVLSALVLGILASGVAAVGVLIARRSGGALMPYGPGLCLGALVGLLLR
ncbi:MAG: prepilin peptidase [Chloroflexi bacterium]|nr:prepilin peptidase [Chloroflexota bacterium]